MQTAVDGSTATVDQLGILLQNGVSQSEVFDMIYADAVLASSFWVNVALAGLSILLFVYMGRNVEDPRAMLDLRGDHRRPGRLPCRVISASRADSR